MDQRQPVLWAMLWEASRAKVLIRKSQFVNRKSRNSVILSKVQALPTPIPVLTVLLHDWPKRGRADLSGTMDQAGSTDVMH